MENFIEPLKELPAAWKRVQSDWLFPLGEAWLARHLEEVVDPRPRQVIRWAHQRWLEQEERLSVMGPEKWLAEWEAGDGIPPRAPITPELIERLADRKVEERIAEQCSRIELNPSILTPDASHLLGLLDDLLQQCKASTRFGIVQVDAPPPPKKDCKPVYDRIIRVHRADGGKPREVAVVSICTTSRTSMARALGRLVHHEEAPESVLIVIEFPATLESCGAGAKAL